MKSCFMCVDCIERAAGKCLSELTVNDLSPLKRLYSFNGERCPHCNGQNVKKVFGLEASYVKGYGFADKVGVKRDMDIHAMSMGRDPYKEHRQVGERREVVTKLQRAREFKRHSKTIHLSK